MLVWSKCMLVWIQFLLLYIGVVFVYIPATVLSWSGHSMVVARVLLFITVSQPPAQSGRAVYALSAGVQRFCVVCDEPTAAYRPSPRPRAKGAGRSAPLSLTVARRQTLGSAVRE